MNSVEAKRNRLNLEIRSLLSVIDIIDGINGEYFDYEENTLSEEEYLDLQIELVTQAKNRLVNVFKG